MSTSPGPIEVLHVDDDSSFTDMVATFLEREDDRLSVRTAASATDGLTMLAEHSIDCIVSDYDMPGRNGIEFLEAVRERWSDVPFVLYTGKGSEEVASEAISAGVTDYLQKETGTDQYAILAHRITNAVAQARAEQEVERTSEYFGKILEHASDYVMIVDDTGQVDYVSPAVERVMGYTPAEIEEVDAFERIHPDDLSVASAAFSAVLEHPDREHTAEYRARHADGSWRWLEVRGRNLLGDPVVDGVVVNVRDVTERIEHERELARRDDLFTKAQNIADVGAWEYDVDTGEITWTEQLYRIHGLPQDADPTAEEAIEFYHPDDRPTIREAFDRAVDDGEAYDIELRLITADGDQRWVRTRGDPQMEDGAVTRVRGTLQDISERKERERELTRQREQFRYVEDVAKVGYWEIDMQTPDARAPTGSRGVANIYEVPEDAPLDLGEAIELYHPEDRPTIERAVDGLVSEGTPYDLELRLTTAAGNDRWVHTTGEPVEHDGEIVKVRGIIQNITERKRQENELYEQNERLEEFTSIVSHDLRNPLNLAEGRLQLAREACDSQHLDGVARAHERMEALIDELLTLARQGETATEVEPVRLADCVETCWRNIEATDATLVTETDETLAADRGRLRQLLSNLCRNAVEHGGDSVTVTVGDLDEGFYVEDDGPGVPPDSRDEVFDPGHSTSEDGTGFGLSIVKRVVETHDWEIRVTDGSDGGARFEITGVEFAEQDG